MNAPVFFNYLEQSLIGTVLLCLSVAASSAVIEDLYVGEAPVDAAGAVNVEAQLLALDEVLFRLTSIEDIRERLSITQGDLPLLIQSRQVVQRNTIDREGLVSTELRERVEFDRIAIDQRLASQEIQRWGAERASVLVWAVLEESFQSGFLENPMIEQMITEAGRVYGLDLVRPLSDALDLAGMTVADIRGGFLDQLTPGLSRYGASAGLMLYLRTDGNQWLSRVAWRVDGVDGGQSFIGESPDEVIQSTFRALLKAMTRRYATDLGVTTSNLTRLRLVEINEPIQYAEVLSYLRGLSMVDSVRLTKAAATELEFEVVVRGGRLADIVSVGQTLEVIGERNDGFIELRLK